METNDQVLDRVRKLLELSKSDNLNESASAFKIAQKLMAKHSITEAMIQVNDSDEHTENSEEITQGFFHKTEGSKMPTWKIQLGGIICRVNQCRVVVGRGWLSIVGTPSDAERCRMLFAHVSTEIDKLTKRESQLMGSPGRTYLNNYRLGAVETIAERLREANREAREEARLAAESSVALVRVQDAIAVLRRRDEAAQAYIDQRFKHKHKASNSTFDREGRRRGREAGRRINLTAPRALGAG